MDQTGAIILAISLIIIMFGMGLSLTIADFQRIVKYPKAVLTGTVNQLILLPLIGFGLASIFDLRPEVAVGIMILVACPGGPTSNLITHLAKGDTALSVTLTAVSSVVTIITIPLIIQFSMNRFMGDSTDVIVDAPQIMLQLVVITLIPISIGMMIKRKAPLFAQRMDRPVKIASAFVFVLVLVGLIVKEYANLLPYFLQAGWITLTLNVLTMTLGYVVARLMSLPFRQRISISIESGIQNGTLAIAIATVSLGNSELAIAAAVYSLLMFVTSIFVILFATRTA
ncbi:MAG: BASS family bile acid:Na+ symporter [Cyclobacteriaceae bacterium]|jgi:BASS family bile acid:Na+ symporter